MPTTNRRDPRPSNHFRNARLRGVNAGVAAVAIVACALLATHCGGDSPSAPTPGTVTITITAAGVSPVEVRVAVGAQVRFFNNDVRVHAMSSDPITLHTDCPAINDVGTLSPGQSRSTGALTVARTCGFHDHQNEFDNTWRGTIIVQ